MVGWHHRLDGHEFEQAPGVGDGQGSLACHSPWGCKESDTTEKLNTNIQLKKKKQKQCDAISHKIYKSKPGFSNCRYKYVNTQQ